ncbi:MAG: DUF4926 domain-containing protein [Ignavibacteria bacterium]|nr:DUF4926 domain-containing protein [Ignavibacteria bacterium]
MDSKFKILDAVALLTDIPERSLIKGQVGTIVEYLDKGIFEIEFSNKNGETLQTIPLEEKNILLLHYENEIA